MIALTWLILLAAFVASSAFLGCETSRRCQSLITFRLFYANTSDSEFMDEFRSRKEKIEVEKERIRLEEANKQAFLKRKPRKLPYEDARRWVQANLGADTKEDFYDLVENGNLRTPYIPKCPEKYYTETREWISWDHFLKGIFDDENPSCIKPQTGVFD